MPSISASNPTGIQSAITSLTDPNQPLYKGGWATQGVGGAVAGAIKDVGGMAGNILHMINQPNQGSPNEADIKSSPGYRHVEDAANWLRSGGEPQGFYENLGAVGAQALEWFGGGELLKLASAPAKAGEAMNAAAHLQQAQKIAEVLKANPKLAGLLTVGLKASKDALAAAGLNYAHTGDPSAALQAGAITGGVTGVLSGIGAGAHKTVDAITAANPEAKAAAETAAEQAKSAAGAGSYAEQARGSIRPTLENLNAVGDQRPLREVMTEEPGHEEMDVQHYPDRPSTVTRRYVDSRSVPSGTFERVGVAPPPVDVDDILNRTHDFTGAADRLAEIGNKGYDRIDEATGGRFRQLNTQLAAAQKAAWGGGPEEKATYAALQNEVENVMNEASSKIAPNELQPLKDTWRKSYVLRDIANITDRSLNGVPGASQVSQAQRGIDGNSLMKNLGTAVRKYGRGYVEDAVGPGRLEMLEEIARQNQTVAKRKAFNQAVGHISNFSLPALGALGGHWAGIGSLAGAGVGEAANLTYPRVFRAIQANPKIAHQVIFAIESGARPQFYGPAIAQMIQKSQTEGENNQ